MKTKVTAIRMNAAAIFALLVVILCCSADTVAGSGQGAAQEKAVLTFALHVSFGEDGFNSSGVIPAVNLALDHINTNPNLLSSYTLEYTLGNTKVQ